jgi:hypothetical protein
VDRITGWPELWHDDGMRTRWFWTLLLPALVVSEHLGHGLTHWVQEPNDRMREQLLAESGHGYTGVLQTIVALSVVLMGAGLGGRVVAGFRHRPLHGIPSWSWAALPVVVFGLQELIGVVLHDGAGRLSLLADPVLGLGAVLELVVGLGCVFVVRKLSVAAHRAGRALAARRRGPVRAADSLAERAPAYVAPFRLRAPAYGGGTRAPPAFG